MGGARTAVAHRPARPGAHVGGLRIAALAVVTQDAADVRSPINVEREELHQVVEELFDVRPNRLLERDSRCHIIS